MAITPRIIIITGPTASGKSGLALSIAQKTGGVIINADSQQVYRELRILTARPSETEEALVPHRLYGFMPAAEQCSAGKWLRLARMEIDWVLSQGMLPIVVGGTGLYIKALLHGMADIPAIAPEARLQAANDYDAMGKDAFAQRLQAVAPAFFTRLKIFDRQRLVRAWEVWLGSGKSLSWWQQQEAKPAYPVDYFEVYTLMPPREELYKRCDTRFAQMIGQGAEAEVKHLLSLSIPESMPVMKSVGVKELRACLTKEISLEQAVTIGQQATRNYAKRQMTWFRTQLKEAVTVNDPVQLSKNFNI